MRRPPVCAIRETSSERIASVSVTKEKGEREKCQCTRARSSHRVQKETSALGAQQPQVHGNDEIVTAGGSASRTPAWSESTGP